MLAYRGSEVQFHTLFRWRPYPSEVDQVIPIGKIKNDRRYSSTFPYAYTAYRKNSFCCCIFSCIRLCFITLFKDAILGVRCICHEDRKVIMKGNMGRSCNPSYLGRMRIVTKNICQATECLTQAKNTIDTPTFVNAFSLVVTLVKTAGILVSVPACLGHSQG
jgi:hypothetical protein